jgi:hypothetical protein
MKADRKESISWGDYADYMEVDYNNFDAGMNIGVGVWYGPFHLDLTYQRGFIDTFSDARIQDQYLYVSSGYCLLRTTKPQ